MLRLVGHVELEIPAKNTCTEADGPWIQNY